MTKTIAVLGATGNQGGSVASLFLSKGWNVRGITRSPTSSKAQTLVSRGISIVKADLDNPSTIVLAFSGAHVIFAVTDFWAEFMSSYPKLKQISDRATGEYAMEVEVRRGKAIVDSAAQVLESDGVLERFILSTLPSFKEISRGKYTYCYHFDGKAMITQYLKERSRLWEKSSLLNMGFYVSNLKTMGSILGSEYQGKLIWRKPGGNDAIHPFVNTDDTGAFVDLLVRSPPNQDLLGVSEMGSYADFMKIWTEVTGVPSEVTVVTIPEVDAAQPGGLAREGAESNCTSAEFGWGKDLATPKELDPQIKLTSMRRYIESETWGSFIEKLKDSA
ncbi:hypothetical protein BGZ60DRAFT_396229 [Tricladium varicosporioides]|nr:hypothetical protein BGZ60DRAFT_396229 [Hymenoscyphus varicosporioides]